MTQTSEAANTVFSAAEQAAAAGDFQTAERLLRELLGTQRATLGRLHPDVANTLNSLAVVCERLEKFEDAEEGYRRAHAIAVASLPPHHPFVSTSLKNLLEFCKVRGVPIWRPPARAQRPDGPAAESPADLAAGSAAEAVEAAPPSTVTAPPPAVSSVSWPRTIRYRAALVTALAAAAVGVALWLSAWRTDDARAPRDSPGSANATGTVAPEAADSRTAVPPRPAAGREPSSPPAAELAARAPVDAAPRVPPPEPSTVTVLSAAVCSDLVRRGAPDWECANIAGSSAPRTLTYYTRLTSERPTTIEHRWYFGGRLHQTMRLDLPAARGSGFRTYSRNTVSPERAGEWKVELRTADGAVLHEERFVVR